MFCTKCGCKIEEGEMFCSGCGTPVAQGTEEKIQMQYPVEAPKKKSHVIPILITIFVLILIGGFAVFAGFDMIQTKKFRETIAEFEELPGKVEGLGKLESEYNELLEEANASASSFRFWKYEEYAENMASISREVKDMNEEVDKYRTQYEKIVKELENDGKYYMGEQEKEYADAKADVEKAIKNLDAKNAKKNVENLEELKDSIIENNKKQAKEALQEIKDLKESMSGTGKNSFENYMLNGFVDKIEEAQSAENYVQLNEDYANLKAWAEKYYQSAKAGDQIAKFIQADVSEANRVKLYLSVPDYEEYNFNLVDFEIYEENNGDWSKCEPIDISQIKGMLTMDLVADVSGSMRNDFYTMQNAMEGFVNSTHSDTTLGLSIIGSIYERHQDFTTNKNQIIDSVWDLECYGLTSLYQSLYSSVVYTAAAEGARCVVAFTDGHNEPYGSGYDYDADDVISVSQYYQVPVYIIGLGNGVYSSELRNIAESTGGSYYDRVSIYDLQNIYSDIYEAQGKMYQLTYKTEVSNKKNRDIYVLYADNNNEVSIRFESELNAQALQEAYETASFNANDLGSFYTDSKYLSSDNLNKLGSDLEAVQTIINIYYAKNGYKFGDGENGQKQLAKMISLGVISENGTLDGDTVSAIIRNNTVLYQNFSALYNYRYELIYTAAYDIYQRNPGISYEDLRSQVHQHYGEPNEIRFDPVVKAAWKAIKSGK